MGDTALKKCWCKVKTPDQSTVIFYLQFAYFKKILEREKKRRHADSDGEEGEEEEGDESAPEADQEMEEDEPETKKDEAKKTPSKREPKRLKPDVPAAATGSDVTVTKDQLTKFQSALFAIFEEKHVQQIPIDDVRKHVSAKTKFDEEQIMACIEAMSNENKIMLASDILYLI